MKPVTHISVVSVPGADSGSGGPGSRQARALYVDAPAHDPLAQEPLASGRYRIERMPASGDAVPVTLWSWCAGTG